MKRTFFVAFCIIALCSLGLVMKKGIVGAYKQGYEVRDYIAITTPTIDGAWTTPEEWTDAEEKQLDGSLNAIFRLKYVSSGGTPPNVEWVNHYILIEFFNDTTNDQLDYWQICYDSAANFFQTPIGGTAPHTDCHRFDFGRHNVSTGFTYYKGNGTAWIESTDYTAGTDFQWADTISSSPLDSNPHWIVEIRIEQIHFDILTVMTSCWIYVAAYDESHSGAGVQSWPSGSSDVPDDWGLMLSMNTPIPETLNIGVMVLLSSVSVLIASHYFRKRSRTESCRTGKT